MTSKCEKYEDFLNVTKSHQMIGKGVKSVWLYNLRPERLEINDSRATGKLPTLLSLQVGLFCIKADFETSCAQSHVYELKGNDL